MVSSLHEKDYFWIVFFIDVLAVLTNVLQQWAVANERI